MIEEVIRQVAKEMDEVFQAVDDWFDAESDLLEYYPATGGWTPVQVLEHISLTNHFLLILIKKGTAKALQLAEKGWPGVTDSYRLNEAALAPIARHGAFEWNRPGHMEPSGLLKPAETRLLLQQQVQDCLFYLQQLPNGEGVLYTTTMLVNNLGKLDVYHYIYFLIQHAKRHLTQLELIRAEMRMA